MQLASSAGSTKTPTSLKDDWKRISIRCTSSGSYSRLYDLVRSSVHGPARNPGAHVPAYVLWFVHVSFILYENHRCARYPDSTRKINHYTYGAASACGGGAASTNVPGW